MDIRILFFLFILFILKAVCLLQRQIICYSRKHLHLAVYKTTVLTNLLYKHNPEYPAGFSNQATAQPNLNIRFDFCCLHQLQPTQPGNLLLPQSVRGLKLSIQGRYKRVSSDPLPFKSIGVNIISDQIIFYSKPFLIFSSKILLDQSLFWTKT